MKHSPIIKVIKWIPFTLLVLLIIFFIDFFIGGIKNRIIRYWIERDNPNISGEVIVNPLPNLDYQLLKSNIDFEKETYPCASSETEAKEILTAIIKREVNSQSYFEKEIQPSINQLVITSDDKFYKLTLPKEIYGGYEVEYMFNCDYFIPQFSDNIYVYAGTKDLKLGILNTKRNREELDNLVWLLNKLHVIQFQGFNQWTELYSSNLEESGNTITRKDEGIYSVFNDIPPFQTSKYRVTYLYVLDKSTGEVTINLIKDN